MKRILFVIALFLTCSVNNSFAWTSRTRPDLGAWWGYSQGFGKNGGAGQFIIGGGVGVGKWGSAFGTYGDEGGVIGVIAEQVVEHGGYFCPYQIQCGNCKKCHQTWTKYFRPNGWASNKCVWLCEAGWSGNGCTSKTGYMTPLDKTATNTGGRFSGVSIKGWGGDADVIYGVVPEFQYEEYINGSHMVVLGVTKFLSHGVIAQPIYLRCNRFNWKHNDSSMTEVTGANGVAKLLCASGYKPNADGSDCEVFDPEMEQLQKLTFCTNFPVDKYDGEKHTLLADGSCAKFFCKDENQAFAARGDTTCVDCSNSVRVGVSLVDGTCKKCDMGQFFNKKTDACEPASAYTKTDVQYGKGNTQSSKPFASHCWPIVLPEDFKQCVEHGGATK